MKRLSKAMTCLVILILLHCFILNRSSEQSFEELVVSNDNFIEYDQSRILSTLTPIINISYISYESALNIQYDPPNYHSSPTSLGLFVRTDSETAKIYYELSDAWPTLNSSYSIYTQPYIQITTPYKASRNSTITLVAVDSNQLGTFRSHQITLHYFVEGAARPNSYGFLIPGIESGGYFVQFGLEIAATERAQVAGGQEFADFFSKLGLGTYSGQVNALNLLYIDPDLKGFEGGFPVNSSQHKNYGILIPYHNGKDFFGKLIRIDLFGMQNISVCQLSYRSDSYDSDGNIVTTGTVLDVDEVCVYILDLTTIHTDAKGFRKGFFNYPYGYLAASQYSVLARIDINNFGLPGVDIIDLGIADRTYGGYSGGFADGTWSCFTPYKSFYGPIGGLRTTLAVDLYHTRPYYYAIMLCVNATGWYHQNRTSDSLSASIHTHKVVSSIHLIDFSNIQEDFRGFSDAIRVGRYAYMTPLQTGEFTFSSYLIRISLGPHDIGTTLKSLKTSGSSIGSIINILDLSKKSADLKGFSSLFTSGQYIILVPFRNAFEPKNGQRGHGYVTRLNMNDFTINGIDFMNLPLITRNQVPSFAEVNLRGFSFGFASGQYAVLVPFYNARFNGKIARFNLLDVPIFTDLQELDLEVDRVRPNVYKGYRGGFVSIWQGVVS